MLLTVVVLMMVVLVSGVASAAFAATYDNWGIYRPFHRRCGQAVDRQG